MLHVLWLFLVIEITTFLCTTFCLSTSSHFYVTKRTFQDRSVTDCLMHCNHVYAINLEVLPSQFACFKTTLMPFKFTLQGMSPLCGGL